MRNSRFILFFLFISLKSCLSHENLGDVEDLDKKAKQSLATQFSDLSLKHSKKGKLAILVGTSTVGKTTLAKQYTDIYPSSVRLEQDEEMFKIIANILSAEHSTSFKNAITHFGSPFFYALVAPREDLLVKDLWEKMDNDRELQEDFFKLKNKFCSYSVPQYREMASASITEAARRYLDSGVTVIFDTANYEKDIINFSDSDPALIYVYCPFNLLVSRVEKRNKEALAEIDPLNFRHPLRVLHHYSLIYRARNHENDPNGIETLTKMDVYQQIQSALIIDPTYKPADFFKDIDYFTSHLLQNMEFGDMETLDVCSRFLPSLLIDTGTLQPIEGATLLKNFLSSSN